MTARSRTDCVLFLTHFWDERLARHHARFARDAASVLPVYLVYHNVKGMPPGPGFDPDIVVTNQMIGEEFPRAFSDIAPGLPGSLYANVNLVWLTAFASPELRQFERIWIIENDVDYSGNWGEFFAQCAGYGGDLIGTFFRWRRDNPGWILLRGAVDPLQREADQLIGFFPVARFSRLAIEVISDSYRRNEWNASFELAIPTTAHRRGLSIADLGGWGELTPKERWGRHYEGNFRTQIKGFHTYGFGPVMQHYYAESRLGYWEPDRLYHPIKINLTGRAAFYSWWLKFRDRTRRLLARLAGREPRSKGDGTSA